MTIGRFKVKFLFIIFILFFTCNLYIAVAQVSPLFTLLSSKETNIDFINEIKENDETNVLAYEYLYNGGGVAVGDINNDGLPDLFFTANTRSDKLFLNRGNFKFTDITKKAKVGGRKDWKTGVTMADVNGDGFLDIYICYSGKGSAEHRRNELYINNGNLTFTESAKQYGVDDAGCSTQAVFFDYDIDGDLDLYVLNHNIKAFKNVELKYLKNDYDSLAADKLYKNDNGHFTDVSKEAGISGNPLSFGLGVAVADINNDGWPDIYVSNDYNEQDYCYINNANGTFSEREMYMFSHLSEFSMGNDIADINNDGLVDIITLDMLPEDNRRQKLLQAQENYELYQNMAENGFHYQFMRNMLQLNNGNGTFSEIGQLAGISNTDWSWAPLLADFDNDGYKDLYVTNGYLRDYTNKDFMKYWGDYLLKRAIDKDSVRYFDIVKMMPSTKTANYIFKNNGDLTFRDKTKEWGANQLLLSNGAAYADLDNDGDLDLIVNNINALAAIYRNNADKQTTNHYLNIHLEGSEKNTFGLGAKVYCYTNGNMQFLEQMPARGYQSSVSNILHFGTGNATQVDSVKVIWLNGKMQLLKDVKADQILTLEQKNATSNFLYAKPLVASIFSPVKSMIDFTHAALDYNDFKRQPLMLSMLSECGPCFVKGDVNNDGRDDIFIAGSQGQNSKLYLQQDDGTFLLQHQNALDTDSISETSDVILFDADGDKDLDIYCVSGGYNDYEENDKRLQDRLFVNDGKGNFTLTENALPIMRSSKSCVTAADMDNDGDVDLFVAGRVIPGKYPVAPQSYLLRNDGTGHFTDVTASMAPALQKIGMITCARWCDLHKDRIPELIITGEWMSPMIFELKDHQWQLQTNQEKLQNCPGLWNTLEFADNDGDGDTDIIAGNWGFNSQIRASEKEPAEMIFKDFDNNGSIDPFLCFYIKDTCYPYVSRDELLDEMYSMRRKFTSYKSYADATITDIFSTDELKDAQHLRANCLATMWFENANGKFIPHQLPLQAQFAPVYKIIVTDVNHDSSPDLILFGNNDYPRLKIGKIDANFGVLLMNDGKGNFKYIPQVKSGLNITGNVKDASLITLDNNTYLIVTANGLPLQQYKLNQ